MMKIKLNFSVPAMLNDQLLALASNNSLPYKTHGEKFFNRPINKFINFNEENSEIAIKVQEFSNIIFDKLELYDREEETYLGNGLIVVEEGGHVQTHIDAKNTKNYQHVRVNFLLSKPEVGGEPVIQGKEYRINENECWINMASIWSHGCTLVQGNKKRVTLTLGYFVNPTQVKSFLLKQFKN